MKLYMFQTVPLSSRTRKVLLESFSTNLYDIYGDADKSLALPGMKKATATEDFDVHISYL
jgi:hypothetical protein